ncbi:antitoxin family protein [Iningainema tapete]|uniref:Antitoxin family protein n=1 Tax=Iningainema tapete BLCC-T55 TaxID=2748662 RepID=A0A8J6XQW4_9CYAN|nr:antitoxin family protein [Iningainema tapete]MBD2775746.1 antitoxin family protein [Iningainema tapete BLCC-T55]
MPEIITAVYENGVLRPLNPLYLQEHQTVRIQVLNEEPAMDAEQIIQSLVAAGLVSPPPRRGDVEPVSEQAWRELTQRLEASPSKPLSEIIIEERGTM